MNTLDQLRDSLASAAAEVTDGSRGTRSADIHGRVRRVRRRRRGAVAGALASVLAVAGLGVVLAPLHQHRSSEPTSPLAGHAISRQVDVAGFTYDLGMTAQSRPGDRVLTLSLPRSGRDRVVRLVASGLGGGRATAFVGDGRPDGVTGSGAASYDAGSVLDRIIGEGAVDQPVGLSTSATRLTVRLSGAGSGAVVGLAVYDQGTTPPAGVSVAGMTFPRTVGDQRLVAATIGRRGRASISITFEGPLRHPDLQSLCVTGERHVWGHVTDSASTGWSGRECGAADPVNDVNLGIYHNEGVPSGGYGPGRHTLTLRAFRGQPRSSAAPAHPADIRLALGLYADLSPRVRAGGTEWDTRLLSGGRMWQLAGVKPYVEGRTTVDATSGPVMLGMAYRGRTSSCGIATGSDHETFTLDCSANASGGASASWGYVLMPGATYTLSTTDPENDRRPGTGLADVLIYRPAE